MKSLGIAMQPDYLTLVFDPRAHSAGLALQPDWRSTSMPQPSDCTRILPIWLPWGGQRRIGHTRFRRGIRRHQGIVIHDLRSSQPQRAEQLSTPDHGRGASGRSIRASASFSEVWLSKATVEETAQFATTAGRARLAGFWSPLTGLPCAVARRARAADRTGRGIAAGFRSRMWTSSIPSCSAPTPAGDLFTVARRGRACAA